MRKRILFASGNAGKVEEIKSLLRDADVEILAPCELVSSTEFPNCVSVPEVEEDRDTYRGNALKKAIAYHRWSGLEVIADDSGLEVLALGNQPGIYTARFAGPGCSASDNREKMLAELKHEDKRDARFVCVLCLLRSEREYEFFEAELKGQISTAERGEMGFGYDPIFIPAGQSKTLAELKSCAQVETHRSRALALLQQSFD